MRLRFKSNWAYRVRSALRRNASTSNQSAAPTAAVPPTPAWDEAFARVESYLRAHHIESRVLLNKLTTEILAAAQALAVQEPHEAPVTLAIRITHARIGEWFLQAFGEGDWTDERFRARGRLALLLTEIPERCPERFLAPDDLPAEVRAHLSQARLQPGPEVRLTGMSSAPLEFPLRETIEERWTTFSRSAFFQSSMSWILIAGVAGIAWLATH